MIQFFLSLADLLPDASSAYAGASFSTAAEQASGVVVQVAKLLGCTPQTVYNYADRYSTVQRALRSSRRCLVAEAQGKLVEMMRDPKHPQHYKAVKDILINYDEETDWTEMSKRTRSAPPAPSHEQPQQESAYAKMMRLVREISPEAESQVLTEEDVREHRARLQEGYHPQGYPLNGSGAAR